jgi:hypothetical protein
MKSMKIALDVDGVLADIIQVWINEYNRKHNTSINKETINEWDFWRELGVDKYEFYYQLSNCWSQWKEVPAMENDVADAVEKLHSFGIVDIVTARDRESTKYVLNWLEHNRIKYKEYVAVPDGRDKANLDYDVFIDDSPHNAVRMVSKGRNVLLYDQPWNKSVDDERIVRIKRLSEAVNIIADSNIKFGNQYKLQKFLG